MVFIIFSMNCTHNGRFDIAKFSYGILTPIPKRVDASKIQHYMSICLFKLFMKISIEIINNIIVEAYK